MNVAVFVLLFVLVVVALGAWKWWSSEKRHKALATWAALEGLTLRRGPDDRIEDHYPLHDCLKRGSNRYATNLMEGIRHGREVRLFDVHYVTWSTDAKGRRQANHHWFSAAVVDSGLPLKSLTLRPEHLLDRVAEFVGLDDIDFELGSFSRAFHVRSPDRRWAYDVFHQRTMEWLLESPRFTVEMQGPWVLVRRDERFEVTDFSAALAVGEGILQHLPEYLLRELKGAGA